MGELCGHASMLEYLSTHMLGYPSWANAGIPRMGKHVPECVCAASNFNFNIYQAVSYFTVLKLVNKVVQQKESLNVLYNIWF